MFAFYTSITERLYDILQSMYEEDPIKFKQCLAPLRGFSDEDILQVTAFYQLKDEVFISSNVKISEHDRNVKIYGIKLKGNVIEVVLSDTVLQLRLKPMNKFTSKSYKINCAVKSS